MARKARPLRADAQRNRQHVLEVAREVFAGGLETPIDEIARRAGLGVGTVYRHFPTKEALFEAIVLDQLNRFSDEAQRLHDAPDAMQAFAAFLEQYLAAGSAKRIFIEALHRSGVPFKRGPIHKALGRIRESLAVVLARAQGAGAIRADVGVDEVLALLRGISAANEGYEGALQGRSLLRTVVLDGLRAQALKGKRS